MRRSILFFVSLGLSLCLMIPELYALKRSKKAPFRGHETFDNSRTERFSSFPKANSSFVNGVLVTKGESGKKYPPSLRIPIAVTDCELSFRYRFSDKSNGITLFVNGDDSFGGYDHIFRVRINSRGIGLQVDAHTKDKKDKRVTPQLIKRPPDDESGAYRVVETFPFKKINLGDTNWHTVKLTFKKEAVTVSLDKNRWSTKVSRHGFKFEKQGLTWFLKGGDKGVSLDDVKVTAIK